MIFRFRAAPLANASGLVAGTAAGHLFLLVVEPKLWREAEKRRRSVVWPATESSLVLRVHEGDEVLLRLEGNGSDARERAVLAALREGEKDEAPETDDPRADGDRHAAPLLQHLGSLPEVATGAEEKRGAGDPFAGVLGLLRRADALGRKVEASLDAAPQARLAALRPLLHLALIEAVEAELHDIRRGYAAVRRPLTAVRGRITNEGLIRHAATGDLRLVCAFDELTEATPLFRVIATALRLVVGQGRPGMPFDRCSGFARLPNRALALVHQLVGIDPLPFAEALRLGQRLRLNRFTRRWQRALTLALHAIRDVSIRPGPQADQQSAAFSLKLVTPTFWERILEAALRRVGDDIRVMRPAAGSAIQPWRGMGNDSRPDLLVQTAAGLWCIDAKYKELGLGNMPSKADQYQLFTYSHVASFEGGGPPPSACMLLYADRATTGPHSYARNPCAGRGDDAPALHILRLRFPERSTVIESAAWATYLGETSEHLGAHLPASRARAA